MIITCNKYNYKIFTFSFLFKKNYIHILYIVIINIFYILDCISIVTKNSIENP